jgi:hypothetical protein
LVVSHKTVVFHGKWFWRTFRDASGGLPPRFLHADIVYTDPFNAAANLAGGTGTNGQGSDVVGDDDRTCSGPVEIRVTHADFVTGRMDGTIFYDPHLRVKDTVDFCPGNLGNSSQREFTLPMSKLEAQGPTRDVPIAAWRLGARLALARRRISRGHRHT